MVDEACILLNHFSLRTDARSDDPRLKPRFRIILDDTGIEADVYNPQ